MPPKRSEKRPSVVPWMHSEQLNKVYEYLYSDNLSKKRWAVDQVSVWNTRCHPSLPTAVETTVSIVRATIQDMLYQADKTFCLEDDIKMLYCMALIRFVNLTLEHHQKGPSKIRLSFLASKLNIPSWLLDLRHEATHSFCPSLSMLRMGADIALRYLHETFWSKEVANVKPKINFPSERESEIANLINQYKSLQFQRVEDPKLRSLSKDFKDVLRKLGSDIFHAGGKFIDTLVQPGNFIAAEDIKKLIPLNAPFIVQESNLTLPRNLQLFWAPLLRKIYKKDLMHMFLEKLLLAQENCKIKICQKTAIAWALQILSGVSFTSVLSDCFLKKRLFLNLPCLVYACMRGGCTPYSLDLLLSLSAKFNGKKSLHILFYMMSIYIGTLLPKEDSSKKRKRDISEELIFTIEDVEEELSQKMESENGKNIWSLPSVTMDFSNIPIGATLTHGSSDAKQDDQDPRLEDSMQIKIEPTANDDFIIFDKNTNEEIVEEEISRDVKKVPVTTRPEKFDMIYRKRPKK